MGKKYIVEGKRVPELAILNSAYPNNWIPIYEPSTDTTKRISLLTIINFLNNSITANSFTEQEVRDTDLAGLVFTDGSPITSVDTVIIALGKLQEQLNIITPTSLGGIAAYALGGQTNATQLLNNINRIDSCGIDLGSIKTMASIAELEVYIQNCTTKKVNTFPKLGERFRVFGTILAPNAPIMISPRNNITLFCYKNENGIFTLK